MALVEEFQESCAVHGQDLKRSEAQGTFAEKSEKRSCPVMILSLKAGGVGLNLTGASRVVHLDRWWNPAVEDQATDRAHRLGQRSTVFVNTLTAEATIEESLDNLLNHKRELALDILKSSETSVLSSQTETVEGFQQLADPKGVFKRSLKK